jgi:hypothetical protein
MRLLKIRRMRGKLDLGNWVDLVDRCVLSEAFHCRFSCSLYEMLPDTNS